MTTWIDIFSGHRLQFRCFLVNGVARIEAAVVLSARGVQLN